MTHIYLGQFEWDNAAAPPHWRAPGGGQSGLLDFRSLPQSALTNLAQGFGIFTYPNQAPGRGFYLGDDINATLSAQTKSRIEQNLDIIFSSNRLVDILWELFNNDADPTGLTRWKPLIPGANGTMELHLGGFSLVKSDRWNPDDYPLVLDVERESYKKIRAECLASQAVLEANQMDWETAKAVAYQAGKNLEPDHPERAKLMTLGALPEPVLYKRYLQALVEKYHIDPEQFCFRAGGPFEGLLPHFTTINENWNCADSANINCDLIWTFLGTDIWNIVSNACERMLSNDGRARADTDLATANHYAKFTYVNTLGSGGWRGLICRKDGTTAETFYQMDVLDVNIWRLFKVVAGAYTALGTNTTVTLATNDTGRVQADGSTIERFRNDVSQTSATDTGITGNLRVGIVAGSNGTGNRHDVFIGADVGVVAARNLERIERHLLRGHLRGIMRGTL